MTEKWNPRYPERYEPEDSDSADKEASGADLSPKGSSSGSEETTPRMGEVAKLQQETKTRSGLIADAAQKLLDELNEVLPPTSSPILMEEDRRPAEPYATEPPPSQAHHTLANSIVIDSSPESSGDEGTSTTPTEQPQPSFPAFKPPAKTPPKSALPLHLRGQAYQRERHNSTNTVLVPNAIQAPNLEDLVRCMCAAICYHIEKCTNDGKQHKYYEIFDENINPLTRAHKNTRDTPDVSTVFGFLMPIFTSERLGAEICIMTLAYIERVLTHEDVALLPNTWRRVTLGALILASKVWEDQSVWNVDFVHCFECITALDLNKLERMFLNLVKFNVGLKASLYVKYFLELQNYSPQQRRNPYNPGEQAAAALEVITVGKQKELKKQSARRTASASDIHPRK